MSSADQPIRLVLDCAGIGVELVSGDRAVTGFTAEYFDPWFRPTRRVPEWTVSVGSSASSYASMLDQMPADPCPRPSFAHDQQVLSLPAWGSGGAINVYDAERSCFLRLRRGHVELIGHPETRRWRFTLLWTVQSIAATRWRRTHVDLHAAAVECAGRALAVAGPKNAGKTTLSFYLMRAGGWPSIANDRTFLGGDATPFIAAGMPTAVKIRPLTLARFPELQRGLPPVARPYLYSAAELAGTGGEEESADGVDFALTPNQIALRLGAATRAQAPLGAIVFPEVCEDEAKWTIDAIEPAEATTRIRRNLYGAAAGERPPTVFEELGDGQHDAPPSLVDALATAIPCYRLRLGRAAYDDTALSTRLSHLLGS